MVEAWTGIILDVDEPSNTDLGYHGGNEIDRINKLLNGVNLTTEEGADVTINTNWYFYDGKLKINDGAGHTLTLGLPAGMTADKTVTFPDANAALATSLSAVPNNFGNNLQQFVSDFIKILDSDQSHGITLKTSGLTANFPLLFPTPGHATDEEVIYSRKAQTLYDKTLSNATFAAMNIFIDSNTIKHSTTNSNNDILIYKNSVSKYDRFPRGTAGQFLRTSLDGTFIEWATIAGGGAGDVTGAANVGTGTIGIFRDEISGVLNFKRLIAGTGIGLTNNANDITIAATGGGSSTDSLLGNLKEGGYFYGWQYPFNIKGYGLLDQTAADISEQNVTSFYDSATKRGHGRAINGIDGGTEGWARFGFVSFMFQRQFSPFVDFWMRLRNTPLDGRGYMFFFNDNSPNTTSDVPLDGGQHGFGLIKRSSDTGWRKISNGGGASQEVGGADLFDDDTTLRHLRIGFDEPNSKMYIIIDGVQTDFTYAANAEPSATEPLFFYLNMDESGGSTDQIMEYYRFYCGMKIPA